LQHCDERIYSPARQVSICNHQLTDLSRAQASPALKNIVHLREKLVIFDPQVTIGQRFECQKIIERKMDMNINEQKQNKIEVTAVDFSVKNRSRSSNKMIELFVV
jgi:hypothetical protein